MSSSPRKVPSVNLPEFLLTSIWPSHAIRRHELVALGSRNGWNRPVFDRAVSADGANASPARRECRPQVDARERVVADHFLSGHHIPDADPRVALGRSGLYQRVRVPSGLNATHCPRSSERDMTAVVRSPPTTATCLPVFVSHTHPSGSGSLSRLPLMTVRQPTRRVPS